MNWSIFLLEAIVLVIAFTCIVIPSVCKNPVWWIHDYPRDIQEKYFESHERIPVEPLSKSVLIKKVGALIFAFIILVILVKLSGADSFISGFGYSYGLWSIVNWYDCFFLDWVLFANIKKVRLPGTEDMNEAYHQKKYHFVQALKGAILGLIPCLIAGLIIMVL